MRKFGYPIEYIRTRVPPSQRVQVPVGFHGGDFRVVVVEVLIGRADQSGRDGIAEENSKDTVWVWIVFILIECFFALVVADSCNSPGQLTYKHHCPLHEIWVIQEWSDEAIQPFARNSDICVVSVISHVWGDEHLLRKLALCGLRYNGRNSPIEGENLF
jgi:hypothetical protein